MNLIECIQNEMNRVRELRKQYVTNGDSGSFVRAMIDIEIKAGEDSIASGDGVRMLEAYKSLQEITG